MAESLYTQKREAQFRGPQSSEDYNLRIAENYKDLVYLYNKAGLNEEDLRRISQRFMKDFYGLSRRVSEFEERIEALENFQKKLSFHNPDKIDDDRFTGTPYSVSEADRNTNHPQYGLITLPRVESSSVSKIRFENEVGETSIPSTFETFVDPVSGTADSTLAYIDMSQPYFAVINETGRVWERNVVVDTPNVNGAQMYLYMRFPTDLSSSPNTNCVVLHGYPLMSTDILEIAYTTRADPSLDTAENFTPLNATAIYSGETDAIGKVPPGGWSGDDILGAGTMIFYFDPKPITAIRIKLQQTKYFYEASKYIYSYGLSKLDVRYDKFSDAGRTLVRFDAPDGQTISSITSITPHIWNVSQAELADVITTRLIWETSYDSGIYTLTPVPFSQRVWVEVSLSKTLNGGTPALSGLVIRYS